MLESTEESHLLITVDRCAASVITVLKIRNDRCHNKANCSNEEKCNSAEICGDLEKRDGEKQIVNKLKTKIEKLEKKIKFALS